MKISQLIKQLQDTKKQYGDMDTTILCNYTGEYNSVIEIKTRHPYTGPYGTMNHNEPVNAIYIVGKNK